MVKVGIIGCGGMGTHHGKTLSGTANVELVGVCDVVREKAEQLGQLLGTKSYVDHRDLLPAVDAVWICTQPRHRLDPVIDSAKAGKHVFAEKPIALRLDEADRMVNVTRDAGVKFMIGYVLRFVQPHRYLQDIYASGELGRLVNCWTRRYMPLDTSDRWYGDQAKSGGVLLDFGSHDTDLLLWMGGEVKAVFAKLDRVRDTVSCDEHAQVLMTFRNGGMATTDLSWSAYLSEASYGVVGSKGTAIADSSGKVRKKLDGAEEEIVDTTDVAAGGETIQEHFVRCIEQDVEPLVTGVDGRAALAVILAAQESGRTGKSVDVASSPEED